MDNNGAINVNRLSDNSLLDYNTPGTLNMASDTSYSTNLSQMIPCCICGVSILANPIGTCTQCLKSQVDATEGIERNIVLPFCKHCQRYQRPPWLPCAWESKELLALCLKKIRGLHAQRDIRLVDASFLYTEPHSRHIKVKLTVQKEIASSAIVEQDCVIEFIIQPTQCDDCKRAFTPHTWTAVVQIRQRVQHKRSLMYLEQVILKNNAHEKVLKVIESTDGFDFQFSSRSAAQRFAEFVSSRLPTRMKSSKQLVSHDPKNNTAFHKHTFSVDVCPVCKDDLVFLPSTIANNIYGGISQFLLCSRVLTGVQLIDPFTLRGVDIACDKYWRHPFEAILTRRHLTEFVVLDIEYIDMKTVPTAATASRFLQQSKNKKDENMEDDRNTNSDYNFSGNLVDVEIARSSDLGVNNNRFIVRSHLGKILRVGDTCLGYDLSTLNLGGMDEASGLDMKVLYDVILVRKVRKANVRRSWLLQRLPVEKASGGPLKGNVGARMELEDFKQDIEEDSVMRNEINLWKDPKIDVSAFANNEVENIANDEDAIKLCDLLQGLSIEDHDTNEFVYE